MPSQLVLDLAFLKVSLPLDVAWLTSSALAATSKYVFEIYIFLVILLESLANLIPVHHRLNCLYPKVLPTRRRHQGRWSHLPTLQVSWNWNPNPRTNSSSFIHCCSNQIRRTKARTNKIWRATKANHWSSTTKLLIICSTTTSLLKHPHNCYHCSSTSSKYNCSNSNSQSTTNCYWWCYQSCRISLLGCRWCRRCFTLVK